MIRRAILALAALLLLALPALTEEPTETVVTLKTVQGDITLRFFPDSAPEHVKNFIFHSTEGNYTGTYFHRVIPGFMIQGGDPNSKDGDRGNDGQGGPAWEDVLSPEETAMVAEVRDMLSNKGYAGLGDMALIKEEFNSGRHQRGTLSMARSQSPDSGGSQFFICVADVSHLDGKYTMFGRVVLGLDVVDEIVSVERDQRDNPLQPLHIKRAVVLAGIESLTDIERAAIAETVTPAVIE